MKKTLLVVLSCCCLVLSASPGLASPFTWTEVGSAGNLPGTANITTGEDPLYTILGNLSVLDEVDMYQIMITDATTFSATTEDGAFFVNDPQLFLFDSAGLAVYMNDEGIGSQSQLPAGDPLGPQAAGLYYLAIGWWDNEPFSAAGRMFVDGFDVMGPDIGGSSPVTSWDGSVSGRPDLPTAYSVQLAGAGVAQAVPEPATIVLFATGLAGLVRSRRRQRLMGRA